MENNIASILFARGIMPDDFISYSTYGAVAEIVKELKQLEAERSELVKENERLNEKLKQWDIDALEAQGGIEADAQTIKQQQNKIAELQEQIVMLKKSHEISMTPTIWERNRTVDEVIARIKGDLPKECDSDDPIFSFLYLESLLQSIKVYL